MTDQLPFEDAPVDADCHDLTIVGRLREVCHENGTVAAVHERNRVLSFEELGRKSDHLAAGLIRLIRRNGGPRTEAVAYLLIDDIFQAAISAIAALKAGMAVAFADLEAPASLHKTCVESADIDLVLTTRRRIEDIPASAFTSAIVQDVEALLEGPCHPIDLPDPRPEQLARVVFTSGSTGRPKCVVHENRLIMQTWWTFSRVLDPQPGERQLILSPLHHVTGSYILLGSLLSGTTLCPYPLKKLGIDPLPAWLSDTGICHYRSGVTVYRMLLSSVRDSSLLKDIRTVLIGGEKCLMSDVYQFQKHFPSESLFITNFGSSECSSVAHWRVTHDTDLTEHTVAAGYPTAGKQIRLLGQDGMIAPDGEIGEIVVKSRYIARGYRGDTGADAGRFVYIESEPGVRIFRTGDFGRLLPDGRLECVGRRDNQVKVNGHRVECAGVESALLSLDLVELAAVIPEEIDPGNFGLTAFVQLADGVESVDCSALERNLRNELFASLPVYAIPGAIRILNEMPLTRSGKIDRSVLESEDSRNVQEADATGAADSGSILWNIWADVLEHDEFSMDDSFFGIGGNSLNAMRLINRVEEAFGHRLQFREIFDHATVSEMAAYLERQQAG